MKGLYTDMEFANNLDIYLMPSFQVKELYLEHIRQKGFIFARKSYSIGSLEFPDTPLTNVPRYIVRFSPTGYEWGYGGSGPHDLAENMLNASLLISGYSGRSSQSGLEGSSFELAEQLRPEFVDAFIKSLPYEGGFISQSTVSVWIDQRKNNIANLRAGFIYLVVNSNDEHKIGVTINPDRRIKKIGQGVPYKVEVVAAFEVADMSAEERFWHDEFSLKRIRNEWFDLDEADIERFLANYRNEKHPQSTN